MIRRWVLTIILFSAVFGVSFTVSVSGPDNLQAQSLSDQILDTRGRITALENEIALTQKQLTEVEKESNSLSKTIKTLDLNQKKLEAQTKLTEGKIDATNYSIVGLVKQISEHTQGIDDRTDSVGAMLRQADQSIDETPVEIALSGMTISDKLDHIYTILNIQARVRDVMVELKIERTKLNSDKTDLEVERDKLIILKARLADQKALILSNKRDKETLLASTKNKESNYKAQLEQKIAKKLAFEKELHDFEAKLRSADLSNIPSFGSGVLKWPVDNPQITQDFGNTDFAKNNSRVYNGKGHNGIDLRATLGTPLKSAASGVVEGTGNTDLGCPGGSYGKWVLVTHNNGLSTLYAHLSLIKVSAGDKLATGDLVGYSGSTGYVTGPHLHFTVYASSGVKIENLVRSNGAKSPCGSMPISPLNGYLNPLLYL